MIEDVDGNRFLDFNAGIAVVAAGHAHPDVNAAIHRQVDDILHYCSSDFYLPAYAELSERPGGAGPDAQCAGVRPDVPVELGTEAVEAALKLARHHTGRPNVIAFLGAFHGRSLGSLSLTASKAASAPASASSPPARSMPPTGTPTAAPASPARRTSSRCCSRS